MKLFAKKLLGVFSCLCHPGYGWCGRCRRSWATAQDHTTMYNSVAGWFPLCESCWRELRTPEARMPFYRKLYDEWAHDGRYLPSWEQMRDSVLAEKQE